MNKQCKDAALQESFALPNGAATTAQATGFDLGNSDKGDLGGACELLIEAPALAVGELADADTMTYDVYHDDADDFGSEELLHSAALVQVGAGGAGAAADSVQVALPGAVKRYVRVKATGDGVLDASGKSCTASLVF